MIKEQIQWQSQEADLLSVYVLYPVRSSIHLILNLQGKMKGMNGLELKFLLMQFFSLNTLYKYP